MKNIRIAVAGNQWITRYLIERLLEKNIPISLLITTTPEQSKRISGYEDLREFAKKNEIKVYTPKKYDLKTEEDQKNLLGKVDLLFVFGWQRLIPEWLIKNCKFGAFGIHGGPLRPPRCRGRSILNWSLILNYKSFFIYLFRLTPGIDDGDIVDMVEFDILPFDDIVSLYHKNCLASFKMISDNLKKIVSGQVKFKKQKGKSSFSPKRTPENSGIAWNQKAEKIVNLIRAVRSPYPSAFTFLKNRKIEINRAHIFDTKILMNERSGTIIDVFPNGEFVVATSDFPIYVREYSIEDKTLIKKGEKFSLKSGIQLPDPIL